MSGGYQQNPFNFEDFGINYLSMNVNGRQVPPIPFTPSKANFMRVYNSLFEGMNVQYSDRTFNIKPEEFMNGYFIVVFPLSGDNSLVTIDSHIGAVSIDVRFADPTTTTVNAILYAEYSTYLEIDKWRNVIQHIP